MSTLQLLPTPVASTRTQTLEAGKIAEPDVLHDMQLVTHLLDHGQTLCQNMPGGVASLCSEVSLLTQGRAHLHIGHEKLLKQLQFLPNTSITLSLRFGYVFYGALEIAFDPQCSESPSISLPVAQLLAQACSWLLYTLEQALFLHGQSQQLEYQIHGSLTKREREVLQLMHRGKNREQIAEVLHIAPATAGKHRQHQVWNVPYLRNIYFTGREDILHSLHSAFLATQTADATRFCALSGLGGIGKTQVAIEYVYRYGHEYNAILWATAGTYQELAASFATFTGLLDLDKKAESPKQSPTQKMLHWLHINQHWLLIFDGVDNLEMISEFLPRRGEGHILLTTRTQATGSFIKGINVTPMGQAESFLLLLRRAKLISNVTELASISTSMRQDAEMICALLGGLPLALDQAATYIEENQCELRNYCVLYQGQRKALLKRRGGANERGYSRSVATTWSSSFQQVEHNNPIAADLLRLLAFLPPGDISQEVLVAGITGLDEVLQPIAQNSLVLDDAIGELLRYSLVGRYPETKILTIHPLVQQVIKDRLDEMAQQQWTMRATQIINHVLSENLST